MTVESGTNAETLYGPVVIGFLLKFARSSVFTILTLMIAVGNSAFAVLSWNTTVVGFTAVIVLTMLILFFSCVTVFGSR